MEDSPLFMWHDDIEDLFEWQLFSICDDYEIELEYLKSLSEKVGDNTHRRLVYNTMSGLMKSRWDDYKEKIVGLLQRPLTEKEKGWQG